MGRSWSVLDAPRSERPARPDRRGRYLTSNVRSISRVAVVLFGLLTACPGVLSADELPLLTQPKLWYHGVDASCTFAISQIDKARNELAHPERFPPNPPIAVVLGISQTAEQERDENDRFQKKEAVDAWQADLAESKPDQCIDPDGTDAFNERAFLATADTLYLIEGATPSMVHQKQLSVLRQMRASGFADRHHALFVKYAALLKAEYDDDNHIFDQP